MNYESGDEISIFVELESKDDLFNTDYIFFISYPVIKVDNFALNYFLKGFKKFYYHRPNTLSCY